MKFITRILIFMLCLNILYTGCGFAEVKYNCTSCVDTSFRLDAIPTRVIAGTSGTCSCGCGGECGEGTCCCGGGTEEQPTDEPNSECTDGEPSAASGCVENSWHSSNYINDAPVKSVVKAPVQDLLLFFEELSQVIFSTIEAPNRMCRSFTGGYPPPSSRFYLNLFCTLLI